MRRRILRIGAGAAALALLAACSSGIVRQPVPDALSDVVQPFGMPGLRAWGDALEPAEVRAYVDQLGPELKAQFGPEIAAGKTPRLDYLALSGGGQWGAFSAGMLREWTESGTRPEFRGVSGVSTGAIIAPFAFLGPDYDSTLLEIYSDYDTAQLVDPTPLFGMFYGTSLADTTPLSKVIARYVTPELLEKIAVEHRKGRVLRIGTTNLDADRPMIWNIGAIAASGAPGALELVRDLIRASAAIPVAFQPIFIPVLGPDGTVYDEMHVDGGASSQVTFISPEIPVGLATREALGRDLDRHLWIIVNNDLEPRPSSVRPRLPAIGQAAVSSLIRGSGIGDVYRLYAIAQRDRIGFNVAWIPADVPCPDPKEDFDKAFMACLYDFGREQFRVGAPWRELPPFFATALPPPQGK